MVKLALPCTVPRCPLLQPCPRHPPQSWKRYSAESRRSTISGGTWLRLKRNTIARADGLCELQLPGCTVVASTADHIIGRAEGGADTLDNLRAACTNCNERRRQQQSIDGKQRARERRR